MDKLTDWLFWYGVDFSINLANRLGITYDEVNIAVFIFLAPSVLMLLFLLNVMKQFRILRRQA